MKLQGQTALVTGGDKGIGRAIALALAAEGADILITFHTNREKADKTVAELKALGRKADCQQADVTKEEDVLALFQKHVEVFGSLDILVNNAGMNGKSFLADMSLDEWNTVLDTNLTGQFLCSREAVKLFTKQGIVEGRSKAAGKIICISSVHDTIPSQVNYSASKGGVEMLVRSMALELAQRQIRVVGISPGAIQTDINQSEWGTEEAKKELLSTIPYNRIGQPEEIGHLAAFLASDHADYITGTNVYIDGGMTLYPSFMKPY